MVSLPDAISTRLISLQFPGTLSLSQGLHGKEQETRNVRRYRKLTGNLAINKGLLLMCQNWIKRCATGWTEAVIGEKQ